MADEQVKLDPNSFVPFQKSPEDDQAQKFQQSMSYAAGQNPDAYAKLVKLHSQTGVPPQVAQGNEAEVQHAADVNSLDYPQMAVSHPRTTSWASNPDNAAVSGADEVQRLAGIETRANSIKATTFGSRLQTNYDNQDFSFIPGLKSVKALAQTLVDTPAVRDVNVNNGRTLGQVFDSASWLYNAINNPLDRSPLQPDPQHGIIQAGDALADNTGFANVMGIPLPTAVSGGLVKGVARTAAGLTTLKNLAILSGAGDLSPNAKALLNTYFASEMIPGVVGTPKRIYDAPNAQEKVAAGVEGLINAYFTKEVVGGIGHTEDLAHIVTEAEQSKLKARSPEKFHEALSELFADHDSLRIPVEQFDTYFQSKQLDPAKVAQSIGVKNYSEAKVSGGQVEIAPQDFIGKLDSEHQKGLLGDVVNPETGMTHNQRVQGEEDLQKWVAEGGPQKLDAETAKADAETQATPEYQDVKTQLREQYITAGETPEVAENYSTLQANVYTNLARETGMKPAELMGLYRPVVKLGEAPDASLNQPAFHGSPYKFDKFSLEHLGKGEGAQAYGYGLYFAGNKQVAEFYREQLTRGSNYSGDYAYLAAAKDFKANGYSEEKAVAGLREAYKDAPEKELQAAISDVYRPAGEGQLYKADIPEDSSMLLFDKPISEQPESVQKSLDVVRDKLDKAGVLDDYLERMNADWGELKGHELYTILKRAAQDDALGDVPSDSQTGSAMERGDFSEAASRFLNDNGINGIKYLDGASRTKGEGNHNYVVFDDSAIKIMKTYYQGGDSQPRGWFRVNPDGSFEIGKTKIGDLSTFVHEPAHSYLFMLSELSKREGASDNLKGDYLKILDFLGAKDGDKLSTEQHEKWARANEQYLREGKAPSEGLKGVFQRFSVWLSSIYKRASDLGVELSDDIRGVMDRLYAAEEGVNRAAKESGDTGEVVDQAKAEIRGKLNEAAIREKTEAWREEEQNVKEAVSVEIDQRLEYQAIRQLRKGVMDDGSEIKLNRDELVKQFGEERVKQLQKQHPGLFRNEGGVDAEVVAEALGFDSAGKMMDVLENTPRRKEAIDTATRAFMTAKHGDIRYDGTLDDQARIALENDKKAAKLHKEAVQLQKKIREMQSEAKDKKAAAKAITVPPIEAFRKAAQQMVQGKSAIDMQPNRYLDASRKASKEAFDALANEDYQKASDAKIKELINHFLFREASKAKENIDKYQAYGLKMGTAKELSKLGLAGQDFLDQIHGFTDRYSFSNETNKSIRERQETLAQFLTRMKDDENTDIPIDPMLLDETRQRNYREVPYSELTAVYDAMRAIQKAAYRVNSVAAEGKRVALDTAAGKVTEKLFESLGEPKIRNASDASRSWLEKFSDFTPDIAVVLPEFIFERWDGLKKQGPWHEYLWDRYNDAVDHKNRLLEKLWPQIEKSISADIDRSKKFYIKSMDINLAKDDILSIAHNAGNESNLDKQMRGGLQFEHDQSPRPISPQALMEILSHLTPEEINLVNSNWKALETLKPDAAELARKRTGTEPKWIEPKPLQVKNGTLEGGYWPVHFDPRFSAAGEKQIDTSLSVDKMFTQYASASTNQGYLVERTKYAAPLSLDWQQTMGRHLNDVVTDISHWEFASDAQRLLKHPQTKTAIISRMGELYYKNLLSWVRNTVKQGTIGPEPSDTLEGFRRNMRSKVSTAVLGFRVMNAVVETGITPILALQQLSPGSRIESSWNGVTTYMRNPAAATRFATEASDYIKHIDTGIDRNVSEAMNQLAGDHSIMGDIKRWSIQSRIAIWKIGAVMAWHAGYYDAMKQGLEGKAAVRVADSIYRMTQESGRPGDLSSVQRNSNIMNELTMFIGPSLIQYNNLRRSVMAFKDQGLTAKTAGLGMTTLIAGLAANTVLFDFLRGKAPDDKKKIPMWILARLGFGVLDGIPIANQAGRYAESKLMGEHGGEPKLIPALQVGKDTVDALSKTNSAFQRHGKLAPALKAEAKAIGSWTGLPMVQGSITGQYIYDVLSGSYKPAHPWSPVTDAFYARPPKK